MTTFDIEHVPWSAPRIVGTRNGERQIREWFIPSGDHPFWTLWRDGYLRQLGYSVSKYKGAWRVTQWRMPDGSATARTLEKVEAAAQRTAIQQRAEQQEVELPGDLQAGYREVCALYDEIERETGNNYRYQLPHIKRLVAVLDAFDGGLDASDTGTGKTPVACAVARILKRELFVVCPKNVIKPWERMARRFDVRLCAINYEMLRTGKSGFGKWRWEKDSKGRKWRRFDYDGSLDPALVLFVFDECHRLKDYSTQNQVMGIDAIDQRFKVLGLSATAVDNPLHMKFVGLLTGLIWDPFQFTGWLSEHGVKRGRWGLTFVGGRQILSKIHRQIFPARASRMRIKDLGDKFPQTQVISEAYDMGQATSAKIQHVYQEMHAEIARLEAAKAKDKKIGPNAILTEILRARQLVELLKVPTFVAMAKDALDEGNAVVVILNFMASVQAVAMKLGTTNTLTGQDTMEHRQRLIDRFNTDDEDLAVLNIKAGGLGIDLHGKESGKTRVVLISPTYSGIDLKQALGRCHRACGAHSVQKLVWAADTLEERVCEKVGARMQRVSIFNDDELDALLAI